jgi:hypothetical protein
MKNILIVVSWILLMSSCSENATSQNETTVDIDDAYIAKGKTIAASTFSILGSNLQKAMKEGGVQNAVKYCNLAASPLVDSLMQVHQASIKRTSLKTRNPKNQPTKEERIQLEKYQKQYETGAVLKTVSQKSNKRITFYAPIYVMELCQKCHGKIDESLKKEDFAFIRDIYPTDEATNYSAGDLRGMWSITFVDNFKN